MSPEVNVNGLKKCCISSVMGMGLVMICCGMKVKRMGMLKVSEENEGNDHEDGGSTTD
jgi:hypothetical protein